MEKEEIEIVEQEDEMMSHEASALLSQLNSEISYGESLGVFTPSEAAEWYAGADACTKIFHLEGLLSHIDRFVASGLARLSKLEKTVDNDLLTSGEQVSYLNDGHSASYQGKGQLISEITGLIKRLESLKSSLLSTLNQKNISASDKSSLINKFYSASADSKSEVISTAENIRIAEEPAEAMPKKSVTADQPIIKAEAIEPLVAPKDPKTDCLALVEQYFTHNQFDQAIDLVEASNRHFNLVEYRSLIKRIEKAKLAKEIPALQAWLKAA
ncbi:hypothetical protein JXA59_02565 [Patescibacteria group bacterium]|nr:hypothetical protein [Patescibacteria group bacterium]